jgi:hypothetical protein
MGKATIFNGQEGYLVTPSNDVIRSVLKFKEPEVEKLNRALSDLARSIWTTEESRMLSIQDGSVHYILIPPNPDSNVAPTLYAKFCQTLIAEFGPEVAKNVITSFNYALPWNTCFRNLGRSGLWVSAGPALRPDNINIAAHILYGSYDATDLAKNPATVQGILYNSTGGGPGTIRFVPASLKHLVEWSRPSVPNALLENRALGAPE